MPLSPEKGSSATNIMPADWAKDVQALVRRHKYNFDAAAKEVGATAKELRMELARQEFGDEAGAPKPKACLLYTSPSPRDATLSRMPSSA